ncbi:MAG: TRAP transporter substrate-binding protein DctP [Leptospirales bacterium]
MKKKIYLFTLIATLILPNFVGRIHAHGPYIIKYASLAPEGSIWGKYVRMMQQEIESRSAGRIKFTPYLGGVAGDEKTISKKLQAGLIHIASFTGQGMGQMLPAVRIFELPMLFNSYTEVDRAVAAIGPDLENQFKARGLVLAGWGEGGFVYLLSKKPINTADSMKGMRIWAPAGDTVVKALFIKYGFVPTYVGIESVLPQLQTGGLEAVYGPPMAVIGLQWFREVNYITNLKLAYSVGGTLMNKRKLEELPPDLQAIILDVFKTYSRKLVLELRSQNDRALKTLQSYNIKMISMTSGDITKLRSSAVEVQNSLSGTLYPRTLLDKLRRAK